MVSFLQVYLQKFCTHFPHIYVTCLADHMLLIWSSQKYLGSGTAYEAPHHVILSRLLFSASSEPRSQTFSVCVLSYYESQNFKSTRNITFFSLCRIAEGKIKGSDLKNSTHLPYSAFIFGTIISYPTRLCKVSRTQPLEEETNIYYQRVIHPLT